MTGGTSRNREMARRFERTASRSTRATVGRITGGTAFVFRPGQQRARTSLRSVRQVLEPGVFFDERELRGADRAVALLADDDLGRPFRFLVVVPVRVAILLLAVDEHDD